MIAQVLADIVGPPTIPGNLDTEPNGQAAIGPALGRFPDGALAIGERHVPIRRRAGLEVDVVGDRDLGDTAFDGLRREDVDRHLAVWRQVGVQMRIER